MTTTDVTIELGDSEFNKLHELETGELRATTRLNEPGEWRVDFQLDEVPRETLSGISTVVVRDASRLIFAGYRIGLGGGMGGTEYRISQDGRRGSLEGLDCWLWLTTRLAFPDPATDEPWAAAHDVRSGKGATVLAGYIEANLGSTALGSRRIPGLTVQAADVGTNGEWSARLQPLSDLAARVAAEANIIVFPTLTTVDERLPLIRISETSNRTAEVVLVDIADLAEAEVRTVEAVSTWVLAAGTGEGTSRMFRSAGGRSGIGRREKLVEATNATTSNELHQIAEATRVQDGWTVYASGRTNASAAEHYRYLDDYKLGDLVTFQVQGERFPVPVTAVELSVTAEQTVETPILGTYTPNRLSAMQEAILGLNQRDNSNIA